MKILIAGGRDFTDRGKMYEAFRFTLNEYQSEKSLTAKTGIKIISGKCPTGADKLGEHLADLLNYEVIPFPADWEKHGKSAGAIRNEQMAKEADRALIFWDGKSKGTLNMINNLKKYNKPLTIVDY